jgi:hypothetical protein
MTSTMIRILRLRHTGEFEVKRYLVKSPDALAMT